MTDYTIDRALSDRHLLGAALGDVNSWSTWVVALRAAFALPLDDDQAKVFAEIAGGRSPPTKRVRELWAIVGRRGGKSRMAAAIAVYLACFIEHRLASGERGMVVVVAMTHDQAKVVYDYALAFLQQSPVLRQEIASVKKGVKNEIYLRNGIVIAIHSNSFRSVRGRTLCGAVFDEVAFWRDESSAAPDVETYTAVLPSLITTNGMLVGISSPYRRIGLLHAKHQRHFGTPSDDTLVVQGSSRQFNQTLDQDAIAAQQEADPTAARSEWEAEFRADISSYLDDAFIDAAVEHGRPFELVPDLTGYRSYKAFCDASGGTGRDVYTLAIGHKDKDLFVIDCVRGTGGKFDTQETTRGYAALLKEYGIGEVTGDNYAAQWVAQAWSTTGISYVKADAVKSRIYLECIPLFTRGIVRLPDHAKLLRELRLLERQAHRGGKESVDYPRGGHDDYANAVCGVLYGLSLRHGYDTTYRGFQPGYVDPDRPAAQAPAADQRLRELYGAIDNATRWGMLR